MQETLTKALNILLEQSEILSEARRLYLLKESERRHFEACLIKGSEGKSHAEKVVNAQASPLWLDFHKGLSELEAIYEFEKLKYEVLDKAYFAEHLSLKIDHGLMSKNE